MMGERTPPSIFIGSSSESLDYAYALERVLDRDLFVTVWTAGVFEPSEFTLSSLIKQAEKTDYAALFLTPDDRREVRGEVLRTPRDNVLFELGLFIGHIGAKRVFLLSPREPVSIPSDLSGVTTVSYRTDRPEDEMLQAVNPIATEIRRVVRRSGPRVHSNHSSERPCPPSAVLEALGRLGAIVNEAALNLEVTRSSEGKYCIEVLDDTRLATSVEIDILDESAVKGITLLGETLRRT